MVTLEVDFFAQATLKLRTLNTYERFSPILLYVTKTCQQRIEIKLEIIAATLAYLQTHTEVFPDVTDEASVGSFLLKGKLQTIYELEQPAVALLGA